MRIGGVQMTAEVDRLAPPYPAMIQQQIDNWQLPMPPYAAYRILPKRWFIPILKDGINERMEVPMS